MEQQKVRRNNRILIKAIQNQDYEAVKNLLEKGSNVNQVDTKGNSLLHNAVYFKNLKIIELLLQHNAQVDIENNKGWRPLNYAVELGHLNTVKILLQYEAEVRIDRFNTCFNLEIYSESIKKLLYENVNVEHTDSFGYTALHHAAKSNNLNGVRTLISRGADVNKVIEQGKLTPLHLARSKECIEILLGAGAEPNVLDAYSFSPLMTLVMNFDRVVIERQEKQGMIGELIRNGANCIKVIDYIQAKLNFDPSMELRYCLQDVLRFKAQKENEHHYLNIDDSRL